MVDKLSLYNGAILLLGGKTLATLTEERKSRRILDAIWEDAIQHCLSQGYWNFAMRSVCVQHTPSIEPDFGYAYAFTKPEDFICLASMSLDEFFHTPLNDFADEQQYWFSHYTEMYVSYVSDHPDYGGSLANWSSSFTRYVELYLASRAAPSVTHEASMVERLEQKMQRALQLAKNKDAMNQGTKHKPLGALASSRMQGRHTHTRTRGGWL